jgi:hypothetical protein
VDKANSRFYFDLMIQEEMRQKQLHDILYTSPLFQGIFAKAHEVELPNWYIAGGCVTQSVWNSILGLHPLHGLKDVDLVYFQENQSEKAEEESRKKIKSLFKDLPIPIDVINEARVHEWYPKKFGYEIPAYKSTEDGISCWLPAFSIGVRPESSSLKIIASFGLSDTFDMVVRPNKRQITEEIFNKMVARLKKDWPAIQVLPWS